MNKSTYLIVSGFLSFGYFNYFISVDILFFFLLLWIIWGFYYFPGYSNLYSNKNRGIVFLFFILFFMSSLTPIFRYDQNIISTIITMRGNLVILLLLTLFKIKPSEDDFYYAFKILAITAIGFSVLAYLFPHFFVSEETIRSLHIRQTRGSTDFVVAWPGSATVVFYFYMTLGRLIEHPKKNDFLWCSICMAYIFIMQNRSTLIGTAPFYIYGILKADIRYKKSIIALIALIAGGFIYNIISSLIEESTNQLNDVNYNRWQAVSFYLFEQKNNLYTILFGQGVPSANSEFLEYIMSTSRKRLAIVSDIGLLGSYFFYGISTIGIIYYFVFKGIFKKNVPLYVKFYCLWILFVPTIHLFAQGMAFGGTIKLLLVIYLIIFYTDKTNDKYRT